MRPTEQLDKSIEDWQKSHPKGFEDLKPSKIIIGEKLFNDLVDELEPLLVDSPEGYEINEKVEYKGITLKTRENFFGIEII